MKTSPQTTVTRPTWGPLSVLRAIRRARQRRNDRRTLLLNVNTKEGYVFVHVPKTAGTSIAAALGRSRCSHATCREYRDAIGPAYDAMFSFAFVRNPWDRFMSLYRYARMHESHHHSARRPWLARYGKHPDHDLLRDASPSDAARLLADGRLSFQWLPQCHWLCDEQGRIGVTYCGRFENMQRDTDVIRSRVPRLREISRLNPSDGMERHPVQLDPEARMILADYYAADLSLFGYRFPEE